MFVRKGFTLVEIMIVVAVIGIIGAVLIRNYAGEIERSHKTTCIMNLNRIEQAKGIWSLSNPESNDSSITMTDLIDAYLDKEPVCPSGGLYSIGDVNTLATCTKEGHSIS